MKNKFFKTLLVAGVVAGASVALAGCGVEDKNNLTPKYEICNFDNQFDYNENFSMVGAKLKITMPDGTVKEIEITDDMIKEMPDMTTPGVKTVIIVYEGVEIAVTITVAPAAETYREVVGVKDVYNGKEPLNVSDLKLVIHYEDGTSKTVQIEESMLSSVDMTTLGTKIVTVSYEGKTCTFEVHVVPAEAVEESHRFEGVKPKYYLTDGGLNFDELELVLTFNDNTEIAVKLKEEMVVGKVDLAQEGQQTVNITYNNKQYSFNITVIGVQGYEVKNVKEKYFAEEGRLNIEELDLVITYKDGGKATVDVKEDMISEVDFTHAGTQNVTITYAGQTYQFSVLIVAETDYEVNGVKTYYTDSTSLKFENLKLVINYSDGSNKTVNVSADMVSAVDFSNAGTQDVTITYNGKSYTFQIEVVLVAETEYHVSGTKQKYYPEDEKLNFEDLKLVITYNSGRQIVVDVTEEMIVGTVDFSNAGTQTVKISYNGKVYEFEIVVGNNNADQKAVNDIVTFLNDLEKENVKKSSLKITINGNAKFLENNAVIEKQMLNIITQTGELDLDSLETGLEVYKAENGTWVCYKAFENAEEMISCGQKINKMFAFTDLHIMFLFNLTNAQPQEGQKEGPLSQILINLSPSNRRTSYFHREGRESFNSCQDFLSYDYTGENLNNLQQQNNKVIEGLIVSSIMLTEQDGSNTGIYINTAVGKQAYIEIIKLILNASSQLKRENIIDPENLKASVDLIKTFAQFADKLDAKEFASFVLNNILAQNGEQYVNNATALLSGLFEIKDQNAVNRLKETLNSGLNNIKNNPNVKTVYETVVAINNVINTSGNNKFFVNQLNNLVTGLNPLNKHLASTIASEFRNFAQIETRKFDRTQDVNVLKQNPGNGVRREFEREEDGWYYYYDATSVENAKKLIDTYFDGLQAIIRSIEDVNKETKVEDFATEIVKNLRKMDSVIQEMNSHKEDGPDKWWNVAVTDFGFDYIRLAVQQYKMMFEGDMIEQIIAAMGYIYPEDFFFDTMVMKDNSMYPTIKQGEHLITRYVKTPTDGDINVDDIIVNEYGTCARVVATFKEGDIIYYITHADADSQSYAEVEALREQEKQEGLTLSWVQQHCPNLRWRDNTSEVCVVDNHVDIYIPLQLPSHLVAMLTKCSQIIYDAVNVEEGAEIDYVSLIEKLCSEFKLKADEYVKRYKAGDLHLVKDIAEKTIIVHNMETYEGEDKALFDACLNMCNWLDDVILKNTKFELKPFVDNIHNITAEMSAYFAAHEEESNPKVNMLLPLLTTLTDTSNDWGTNVRACVDTYKSIISEIIIQKFCSTIPDLTPQGREDFETLVNTHLNAYINNQFNIKALIEDFTGFIDNNANDSGVAIYKSGMVLAMILANTNNENVDYNELFDSVKLPDEIKDIDFNTLIKQTLRDKNVYKNLFVVEDVEIQFVTNEEGQIVKEVLTLTVKTQYDIMISSMDVSTIFTFEIEF